MAKHWPTFELSLKKARALEKQASEICIEASYDGESGMNGANFVLMHFLIMLTILSNVLNLKPDLVK